MSDSKGKEGMTHARNSSIAHQPRRENTVCISMQVLHSFVLFSFQTIRALHPHVNYTLYGSSPFPSINDRDDYLDDF